MERRWKVLIVVSVAVFVASLDLFIVNIAFPDIEADFTGSTTASLSWILNAYAIVYAALLVPAGRLADRYGRRRGFLVGLSVFVLGSVLCGAAPSVDTLIAARVLQAAGAAILTPTSLALLLPEFPPAQRATAIGIWAAVGGVAAAAGPPLGGLLVQIDWRLVFFVNLPIGLVALFFAARLLLQEERHESHLPFPDLLGTVVLTIAIGVLALGLVQAPDWGWGDPRTIACFAGAAVALAVFWARCARHPSPVVDLEMLKVRSFSMANLSMLLFSVAFATMLLSGVLFLTGVWGDSVLRAGFSLTPGPAMAAIVAVNAGRIARRVAPRFVATAGCLLFGLGALWWITQVGVEPDYAGALLPGMIITGSGVGLVLPSLSSAATSSLPPQSFATGSAVLTMSRQIGSVLGVAGLVAILNQPDAADPVAAFDSGWLYMLVAAGLGAVFALAIGVVRPHELPVPEVPSEAAVAAPAATAVAAG